MSGPRTTTYSFDAETLALIDAMAVGLSLKKSGLIRCALSTLLDEIRVARADMLASLAMIRQRHPSAEELTVDVSAGADGEPEATVRIDGAEHPDVGARAAISAAGDTALVFLTLPADLPDGPPAFVASVGSESLLIRVQFPIAELPWPPQRLRTVIDLKEPEPAVPEVANVLANV